MNKAFRSTRGYQELRKKANQLLTDQDIRLSDIDQKDWPQLAHELEIQQTELELQNEELNRALKGLEYSRNKYFEQYQSSPVALVNLDKKGLIQQINKAASEMMFGRLDYLIGSPFSSLIVPEDHGLYFSFLKDIALGKAAKSCELRLLCRQNVMHVAMQVVPHNDRHENFLQWRLGLIDITGRKQAEEALRAAYDELSLRNRQLARLATELTLVEDRERRRLAGILHDDLQQLLAGARLHVEMARNSTTEKDAPLEDALDLITRSIQTSRTLCTELAPPVLYMHGLSEALKWLASWMWETHRIKIDLNADPFADPPQEELKVLLFQSVRELLFNVVKHSGTDSARVDLKLISGRIIITVSDKGAGCDPHKLFQGSSDTGGYGLFTIRERLQLLGGDFEISGHPGHGTTATLTAPIRSTHFGMPASPNRAPGEPDLSDDTPGSGAKATGKIRLLLVDDHPAIRQGLSSMLSRYDDIQVAGEAADGGQAVEQAQRIHPDVILMDISMPVMDGIKATRIIHSRMPRVPIIVLSMYDDDLQVSVVKKAGAANFLSKSSNPDAIIAAIRNHYHDMQNLPS